MAVLMLCSCNEMENAPTNKFTDNSYWTSTTKAQYVVNKSVTKMPFPCIFLPKPKKNCFF